MSRELCTGCGASMEKEHHSAKKCSACRGFAPPKPKSTPAPEPTGFQSIEEIPFLTTKAERLCRGLCGKVGADQVLPRIKVCAPGHAYAGYVCTDQMEKLVEIFMKEAGVL